MTAVVAGVRARVVVDPVGAPVAGACRRRKQTSGRGWEALGPWAAAWRLLCLGWARLAGSPARRRPYHPRRTAGVHLDSQVPALPRVRAAVSISGSMSIS